jgi:hypothetical protein
MVDWQIAVEMLQIGMFSWRSGNSCNFSRPDM